MISSSSPEDTAFKPIQVQVPEHPHWPQLTDDEKNELKERIKQLLKLASIVAEKDGQPVTPDTIKFVKRFRPNAASREVGE